ncbi:hypothetical protein D3C72_1386120 [compost metagenome]
MVMPGPRRRDDEIPGMHGGAFAVDGSPGALAFDDKAQRRLRMAVAGGDFAGQDQLQARVQRGGDAGLAGDAGVLQHQHAAHRFLGADDAAGLHHQRADLRVLPDGGNDLRPRLRRHQGVQRLPQRGHVAAADFFVVGHAGRIRGVFGHAVSVTFLRVL